MTGPDRTGVREALVARTLRPQRVEDRQRALDEDPELSELRGYVQDSGEGRWTIEEAINNAVPAPVMTAALYARFASRQEDSPAMKAVSALRNQFGGHAVQKSEG